MAYVVMALGAPLPTAALDVGMALCTVLLNTTLRPQVTRKLISLRGILVLEGSEMKVPSSLMPFLHQNRGILVRCGVRRSGYLRGKWFRR